MKNLLKVVCLLVVFWVSLQATETMTKCQTEAAKKCKNNTCRYNEMVRSQIVEVTNDELVKMMDSSLSFYLIDVRDALQFERGHIKYYQLMNIDKGHIEGDIESAIPNLNDTIVLYCCTGRRSAIAAKNLTEMGYKNVLSLKGGMVEWVASKKKIANQYGEMVITNDK
jgi:rhodanese-related sulfurtransferase